MQTEKDFLKRRLEEAIFHFWLLKKHSEKMPEAELSISLAEEYRKKYVHLMKEYLRLFGEEYMNENFVWSEGINDGFGKE
ncbi:MAG: hypothetical protein IJ491_00650 [Clostridia bacterium]|nr:hypothetical protein [Clostridia bacterium]